MQHFISQYGYLGLFLLSLLSSACIPVPSEVAFGLAGAYCTTSPPPKSGSPSTERPRSSSGG